MYFQIGPNGKIIQTPAMEDDIADLTSETRSLVRSTARNAGRAAAGGDPMTNDPTTGDGGGEPGGGLANANGEDPGANPDDAGGGLAPDGGGDDMGMGDMGGDDMGMGDDGMGSGDDGMGGMDDMGGMGGGGELEPGDPDPHKAQLIVNLQENVTNLYGSLTSLESALHDYNAPSATPELRQSYNDILRQMARAKSLLEDLLSTKFLVENYPSKLRRYTVLRHVYSMIVDQLDLHFQAVDAESGRSPEDPQ